MLKIALKRLVPPAALVIVFCLALLVLKRLEPSLGPEAPAGDVEIALGSMLFLSVAWFVARLAQLAIKHGSALRGYKSPRLYHQLTGAVILLIGVVGVIAFASGGTLPGVLATSSVAIAIIGFALRKAIADIFSGVTLGLERPFNIGDWIEAEDGRVGQVLEINWRSTRLQTRNKVHLILPNSRLAEGRIVNFSAPQRYYRTQVRTVLGTEISVARARSLLMGAVLAAPLIRHSPAPDVRVEGFVERGIAYLVRFWISDEANEVDCRDAVLAMIDRQLRIAGIDLPTVQLLAHTGTGPATDERTRTLRTLSEVEPFRYLRARSATRLAEGAMRIIVPRGQGARRVAARPEDYVLLTEGAFGNTDGSEGTKRIFVPGDLLSLPGHDTAWTADPEPVAVADSAVLVLRGEDVEAALLREAEFRRAMQRIVRAAHRGAGQSRRAPAREDGLLLPA